MKFHFCYLVICFILAMSMTKSQAAPGKHFKKPISRAPNGKMAGSSKMRSMVMDKKQSKHYQSWLSPRPPVLRQFPEM